ncbi:MAG: hypothetical protein FWD84_02665, partial [Oscillospiraceae bacterium]|nr:hypothetical protein [Oscillospiraceae bacterium]
FVASTNSLHKVYELVEANSPLVQLRPDEVLLKLTYTAGLAQESLLHQAAEQFGITTNIFFGNVDLIQDRTIGNLVIIVKGSPEGIKDATQFLQGKGVKVEEIKK